MGEKKDMPDVLAWVEEHGGLDSVKKLLDWVVGHCSTKQQLDFDFWLSGRVMYELGFEEDMADRDEVERRLLARLMPEGIEWPRFKSGGPVGIDDRFTDRAGIERTITCIRFYDSDFSICAYDGTTHYYKYGEPVAPAPVPAADGKPLLKGDKPYRVDNGKQVEVRRVDPNYGEDCVFVGIDGTAFGYWLHPDQLTHTKPEIDTWERIEEDLGDEMAKQQCGPISPELACRLAGEFMRRCRALAERERGE